MKPNDIEALRKKFNTVHPLIFHRSVEQAKTPGELFDILDTIPKRYPITWSSESKRWVVTDDFYDRKGFFGNDK